MTACQPYTGSRDKRGYGVVSGSRAGGIPKMAHRVAWEAAFGPIPAGMHVLHRCDNPPCVNPEHLFLGTNADNVRDRDAKGRTARGERHGNAVLTEAIVLAIRERRAAGLGYRAIAREFGLPAGTVWHVASGNLWRSV